MKRSAGKVKNVPPPQIAFRVPPHTAATKSSRSCRKVMHVPLCYTKNGTRQSSIEGSITYCCGQLAPLKDKAATSRSHHNQVASRYKAVTISPSHTRSF